ncbi:MAG: hypothetical protein M3Z33_07035 [Actinomycetota bacterium]|nr:hypothetical protein [Actinomycetota bacterium]
MFEHFTEPARELVIAAQEEARNLKHNYLGPEHLLLGLLREQGLAARVLESSNVTLQQVCAQVAPTAGTGDEVTSGEIPVTSRGKQALELALRESFLLRDHLVRSEHILLGLMGDPQGVVERILVDASADSQAIRNEIIRVLPTLEPAPRSPTRSEPDLDELECRKRILGPANRMRLFRAALKRELTDGKVDLADVIADPPRQIQTAELFDLLLFRPGRGDFDASYALISLGLPRSVTVGSLSEDQRLAVARILRAT